MNHPTGLRIATEVDQQHRQDPSRVYRVWLVRLILALLVVLCLQVFLTFLQGRSPGRTPENPPALGENRAAPLRKQQGLRAWLESTGNPALDISLIAFMIYSTEIACTQLNALEG